ncbi:MAG: arginine--tRNA ligase [Oscillospiraceae bacterium]|nr:arginine--tRNA ligase [Oscillospiraceae bacterium]
MLNPQREAMDIARKLIADAAESAMQSGKLPQSDLPDFNIEVPADSTHGDLASNFAMASARAYHMSPRAIAQEIADSVKLDGTPFCKIEIAGPGFINLFYGPQYYNDVISSAVERGDDYGRTGYGEGKKVQVEFVSANPTGPMHLGNARGGAIGDVLASVLDRAGYVVEREFYINDTGNQIKKFGDSLAARYRQITDPSYPFPEDGYKGEDISVHARSFAELNGTDLYPDDDEKLRDALVGYALPRNIAGLRETMEKYGIHYDVWFHESSLYEDGTVDKIMSILEENGALYEKDGAVWLKTSKYLKALYLAQGKTEEEVEKLELKDDVLRRSNGFYTYFASDIAYHYNKFFMRGFDRVINVWGADHHGHVNRLKASLDAVGLNGNLLDIVLMQLVELVSDGKPVRMSKRTGKAITLTDLLDEVPIDAVRFFFNLREPSSHFEFDLDLAVKQEKDNPVYYVQYAHARMCSVLRALVSDGYPTDGKEGLDASLLATEEEKALIRKIGSFPSEIIAAAREYDPSRITRFATDTATLFHRFYTVCRVKDSGDRSLTLSRTALCVAAKQVIANCLTILGVSVPEVM